MKTITTLIFALFFLSSFAQKEDRNWVFGDSIKIDFNNLSNPSLQFANCINNELNASISDKYGSLKIYLSNQEPFGVFSQLRNNLNELIVNGDSIRSHLSATNGGVFLPMINDSNKYYFLTIGNEQPLFGYKLYYSIIDFSQNSLGEVTSKNVLIQDSISEKLLAIRHGNGRDWWLITNKRNSSNFVKFLITPSGIEGPFYQTIGSYLFSDAGEIATNPIGNKIGVIGFLGNIDIYDFDRCTGDLSNWLELGSPPYNTGTSGWVYYGCCFSPDGNRFYLTRLNQTGNSYTNLCQYTLNAVNPQLTRTDIVLQGDYTLAQLELAPDYKIYIAGAIDYGGLDSAYYYLSVINNPNDSALACSLDLFSFYLGGHQAHFGLPNMPNYNLGALPDSPCDTLVGIGIKELQQEKNIIRISSNPSNGIFQLISQTPNKKTITVFDLNGRKIFQTKTNEEKISVDLTNQPKGIYFIQVVTDVGVLNQKITLQ